MTGAALGMMAFWSNIEPAYDRRFQEWHNCEHIPERVGIPGFRLGRRFRIPADRPRYFMCYETDTPDVLGSEAYLARLNDPSKWTQEALQSFRDPDRNIYRLVAREGVLDRFGAPYALTLRFNRAGADEEDAVRAWTDWLDAVLAIESVQRVALWRVDEAISGIRTAEKKIYGGGGVGSREWLILAECGLDDPRDDARWPGPPAHAVDLVEERGWLEFSLADRGDAG